MELDKNIDPLSKYVIYREAQKKFASHKLIPFIMKYDRDDIMGKTADLLDIYREEKEIFIEEESQQLCLFDYAINEYLVNSKTIISLYTSKYHLENNTEREIAEAYKNAYSSLFRVVNTSPSKGLVFLKDIFGHRGNIRLIDKNFSSMATTDVLLFTRVLPFKDFNMTSGVFFVFPRNLETMIFDFYQKSFTDFKSYLDTDSQANFLTFYYLNQKIGIPTLHI